MEEKEIIMNAFHHAYWGHPITSYFWLVGASAGSFVISSLGWVFGVKRYKPISIFASITAIVLLLIVPVVLVWDLGKPARFFHLFLPGFWHYSSPMSWGTLLVAAYPSAMMVYTWFVYRENQRWAKVFGLISIVLAVSTHWYTGVVMQLNPGRELNHTAMAALIFLTGAFVSGVGFMIFLLYLRNLIVSEEKRVETGIILELGRLMGYGIAFDLFLMFSEFLQFTYGTEDEAIVLYDLLLGEFIWPFFWGQVFLGLLMPLIVIFSPLGRRAGWVALFAAFFTFEGTWGMRVWWVLGGQFLQTFF